MLKDKKRGNLDYLADFNKLKDLSILSGSISRKISG